MTSSSIPSLFPEEERVEEGVGYRVQVCAGKFEHNKSVHLDIS